MPPPEPDIHFREKPGQPIDPTLFHNKQNKQEQHP